MEKIYNATIRAAIGLSVGISLCCGIIACQLYFDAQKRFVRHEKADFQIEQAQQEQAAQWLI